MTVQNVSGSQLTPAGPNEQLLKQQRLLAEFPLGVAPFTRESLLVFGLWGGIVGAGLSAAVNFRRINQAHAIPALLLMTLALLILCETIFTVILGLVLHSGNSLDQNAMLLLGTGLNIGVGVLFAAWCAGRQRSSLQRWLELGVTPRWRDQGGWLRVIGWMLLNLILANLVISAVYPVVGQATLQVMFPQHRYTAQGVSVTLPAGWDPTRPEQFGITCNTTTGVTCLAIAKNSWSGASAMIILVSVPGLTTESVASEMAVQINNQDPSLPRLYPHPLKLPSLKGRAAVMFSGSINAITFISTTIADGTSTVSFILNCPEASEAQCTPLRDQIVATLEFASAS